MPLLRLALPKVVNLTAGVVSLAAAQCCNRARPLLPAWQPVLRLWPGWNQAKSGMPRA